MAKRIVKQGETGLQIARELGISYSSLLSANPGVSSIRPGVTLRIPTTTTSSAPSAFTYGPKGYTGPKDTSDPGLPPPPALPVEKRRSGPGAAALPPPIQPTQPRYIPPDMRPTDPTRIAPRYVPPDMRPTDPTRFVPRAVSPDMQGDVTRQPQKQRSPGRIITESILGAERTNTAQDILNRLFNVRPPSFTQDAASPFFETFRGSTLNDPEGYKALWQGIQARNQAARAEGRPSTFTGGAVGQIARDVFDVPGTGISTGFGDLGVAPPDGWESSINQVTTAQAQGQERGVQWYRMLMGEGREDRMFAYVWDEETPQEELLKQRAGHVADSLNRDDYPQIILESDRRLMKMSNEDMQELGYVWDEDKEHWIYGGAIEEPQTFGAASLPGWGYNYPRRGGGGGRGGGSYSYPSYLPRKQEPFPQSFVGREQPGGIPGLAQIRAARFGAITWRI